MPEQIAKRVERAIEERVFPGCVIGVVAQSGKRSVLPFGKMTYEADAPIVRADTIYDVASITKSIPTASLALRYLEEGSLRLDDKLTRYVYEFKNSDRELVSIRHLLTYTLGGYALAAMKDKTPAEMYEAIMRHDFTTRPGTGFLYSNVPAFLLGVVVEKVGGHTLDNLAFEYFFNPLHMERTTFFPNKFLSEEIAPTEIDTWRGLVHGVVHDESAYVFTVKGGRAVGHAGLFSTAPDLLTFLEMLLNRGEFRGHRYFSSQTITEMSRNQIAHLNASTGLGWQLFDKKFMGKYAKEHTFGKTGFTGTAVVCDIERGVAFVILSNRTYPKRPADEREIRAFQRDIADHILGNLHH